MSLHVRSPRLALLPLLLFGAVLLVSSAMAALAADQPMPDVEAARTLLRAKCARCHGDAEPKGGVNVLRIGQGDKPAEAAELLRRVLNAVDANDMPPEDEPQLSRGERETLARTLRESLRQATAADVTRRARPLHRLTRFQYNHAVRDLFQLNRDVFELPEKLMTRRDPYLLAANGRMPERVQVVSQTLHPPPGLTGVKSFPQDLRAEHGFDNQANKLTLSPLLLDAFLRLGVSIVESPDFNPQTVGVWDELFREPAAAEGQGAPAERRAELARRLQPFLRRAFRGPIDAPTLERYVDFAEGRMRQGASFPDAMKRVASAVLSSPRFLYRAASADGSERSFELASRLSFFLWGSLPDAELLDLAERGELARPDELRRTVERMLNDPKIERFLDTFPAQWLQLDNVLAVTPDPKKSRYFRLDENYPAALPMLLEPLLLFDAVFVENRPVVELIAPTFSYRNAFLRDWYETDLAPPRVDPEQLAARNREIDERRRRLETQIADSRALIDSLVKPVREKRRAERRTVSNEAPAELRPLAVWEFDGDLKDSVAGLDLAAHGEAKFVDGKVLLERAYLQSPPLKRELKAKTLEAWCELPDVQQRGGGVMTIQGPGDFFDSIVLGERKPQHWISGSNGFARTDDFAESQPEATPGERLHLAMVYAEDGTTRLYRNGVPYGQPFRKDPATFPKDQTTVLFGLRHLPPGGNKQLRVTLEKARLYDRALTAAEVATAATEHRWEVTETELALALSEAELAKLHAARRLWREGTDELARAPRPLELKKVADESRRAYEEQLRNKLHSPIFERAATTDPRYGGIITNAAVLSMTSGPLRTQPIARGSWIVGVVFNDPPLPPPNNVPPLKEEDLAHLTIREQFAAHRANPSCAGCHAKIDPLGFALENFDITGRWRDKYENGRPVDATGTLFRRHDFTSAADFKAAIVAEKSRFTRAFVGHLLRFALARELTPADTFTIDDILSRTSGEDHRLRALLREIAVACDGG